MDALRAYEKIGMVLGLVAALVAAAPGGLTADDDAKFDTFKLSVAGKLLQHWVEDLNNDGLEDILAVHRKGLEPAETRWVSIFWQAQRGGFATAPDQSWELDRAAAILDIGDVDGDTRKEICYVTGDGVRFYPLRGDAYDTQSVQLISARGLTVFPSKRDIPMIDFVRDWVGDEKDEVAVATFDGLTIYKRDATGKFSSNNNLHVELETSVHRERDESAADKMSGFSARYSFPTVRVIDFNNDGRRDFIATNDERVVVHLQNADGTFAPAADADVFFDVLTQQEKLEGFAEIETLVSDLNGDGYADAVINKQTAKGLTSFRGVVNVFYGRPGGFRMEPDQVIISEGTASVGASFLDVNGDGRKDMVLPSIQLSIAAVIRILVTRSIKVYFNIFLLNEDNRLSERPDFTKEVKFKIDFAGESDEQAMDLEGDYNGDKRTDFVFATDRRELSIYLGEPSGDDRLFSKKPVTKVEADAYGELSSPDLNNDGYSDMIIRYPEGKDRQGELQVLINRGRW